MQGADAQLPPQVIKRLIQEIKELTEKPPEGIVVLLNEDNVSDIQAELEGPAGTPYEGGLFRMKMVIPTDFPNTAPKGYFITKIFHPNIRQPSGEICVNTLKKDWQPTHGLRHILMVIRCLLIEPFPESALNEDAAKMLLEEYDEYFKRAKMLTGIHAKNEKRAMANATNTLNAGEGSSVDASPNPKKAKAADLKALERKRSLKRL